MEIVSGGVQVSPRLPRRLRVRQVSRRGSGTQAVLAIITPFPMSSPMVRFVAWRVGGEGRQWS